MTTHRAGHPVTARRPSAPPAIAAERCVHNKAVVASCRACADACPRGAWVVDGDGVSIDLPVCDGCGLCAAACPQSVIAHGHRVARRRERTGTGRGQPVAFAACSRTGLRHAHEYGHEDGHEGVEGVLPCLNVLGLADLVALYGSGIRKLVVARGVCASCTTGSGTAVRLERAVAELNVLLEGRGLPPLLLTRRSATPWRAHMLFDTVPDGDNGGDRAGAEAGNGSAEVSRRGLFRLSGLRHRDGGDAAAGTPGKAPAGTPLGRLLPPPASPRLADAQPWPWVPSIDASVCEGCAGCARLCPTGAIRLDAEPAAFRIAAEDCTGCRLCVDVCRPDALILERLAPRRQTAVPLHARHCPSCGVTARLPAPRPGTEALCPVCRRTAHRRQLFQVLDQAQDGADDPARPSSTS